MAPKLPDPYIITASIHEEKGNLGQAVNLYYLAAINTPQKQSLKLWMKVEELAFEVGQFPLALKAILRIMQLDKRQEERYLQRRILIKLKSGDIDNAHSELKKFRTSYPDNLEFLVDYGNCCLSIGQKNRGLKSYLQYITSTIGYGNLSTAILNTYNITPTPDIAIKLDIECLWPLNNAIKNTIDLLLEDENELENLTTACVVIKLYYEYIKKLNTSITGNIQVPLDIAIIYVVCKLRTPHLEEQAIGVKLLHNIQNEIKRREDDQRNRKKPSATSNTTSAPSSNSAQTNLKRKTSSESVGNFEDENFEEVTEVEDVDIAELDETEEELFILRQRCRIASALVTIGRYMHSEKSINAVLEQMEFMDLSKENKAKFWTENKCVAYVYVKLFEIAKLNTIDKARLAFDNYFSYPDNENDREHLFEYASFINRNYDKLATQSSNLERMLTNHLSNSYISFDESKYTTNSSKKDSPQELMIDNDEMNDIDIDATKQVADDSLLSRKYTRVTFTENLKLIQQLIILYLMRKEMVIYVTLMLACLKDWPQSFQIDYKKHFLNSKEILNAKNVIMSYDKCAWLDENQNIIRKFIMVICSVVPVHMILEPSLISNFLIHFNEVNMDDSLKIQGKMIVETYNDYNTTGGHRTRIDATNLIASDNVPGENFEKSKSDRKKNKKGDTAADGSEDFPRFSKRKSFVNNEDNSKSNIIDKLLASPENIELANELSRIGSGNSGKEYSRTLESFQKIIQNNKSSIPLTLLAANDELNRAKYGSAVGYYVDALKLDPEQPVTSLCLGTLLIFLSCHPLVKYRIETLIKGLVCLKQYENTRKRQKLLNQDDDMNLQELSVRQEVLYNFGHAFQDLSMNHIAQKCYTEALQLVDDNPLVLTKMHVTREAAHNLVLILKHSESYDLCQEIMRKYLQI